MMFLEDRALFAYFRDSYLRQAVWPGTSRWEPNQFAPETVFTIQPASGSILPFDLSLRVRELGNLWPMDAHLRLIEDVIDSRHAPILITARIIK